MANQDNRPSSESIDLKYKSSKKSLTDLYEELGDLRNDFRNCNLMNLIASKVKGDSVLDIGCGNGFLLGRLGEKGKKTFGIEPNEDLIKIAKRINLQLNVFRGFAEDISELMDQKVDTITMIDVLEHIENDDLQIKKIHDCLNRKGNFIVVVPANQFLYGKRDKNIGHYRRYSKKNLIKILLKNGFKIKHIQYWNMLGFVPYLFYEKVLKKEMNLELRTEKKKSFFKKLINNSLSLWVKHIENNFNLGFGLSLICIAKKND